MSKRKEPEPETPGTAKKKRSGSASQVPDPLDPLAISFDDDEAPPAPKWGSDPDALKGPSSQWKIKLINTKNPSNDKLSYNVCVLHCLPFAMNNKQDEITAAANKVAFGGSCSAIAAAVSFRPCAP